MFLWNDELLRLYYVRNGESKETLVDFGHVPTDSQDRWDWEAECTRFLHHLRQRGFLFEVAMFDGHSGLSPLYMVRLDRGDFKGPRPVDLLHLKWVVEQLCLPGQTAEIRERVLGVRVLPDLDNLDLGNLLAGLH